MTNRDVDKYSLSDEEKAELRRLRNKRRNTRLNRKRKNPYSAVDRARMLELMQNGARK